ncbi:hypothetical protein CcI49_27360 [Frankia sp. CcI49]|uniref:NAD(P)/FAD-dependent oxidoreductase n=1 Tax=Frankia sp. CcI49 TaxID=1745382 RepID=UPI0009763E05|nr:FAD-binding protein [Frankia sp. CcI49]ONH56187.1 hypothetical protein CcI49_27360 [Frankia sp. CcI49]
MTDAVVTGAGLAGLTCAYLLAGQGRRVLVTGWRPGDPERASGTSQAPGETSPPARWLVLNELTIDLLREVWDGGSGLFDGAWPVRCRYVRWGGSGTDQPLEQRSLAVDGAQLAQRLGRRLAETHPDLVRLTAAGPAPSAAEWLIAAGHPSAGPAGSRPVHIGRRHMISAEVELVAGESAASHLVATGPAWIFLAPVGPRRALVQAMVPGPVADPVPLLRRLLDGTELGRRLVAPPEAAVVVPAAPRLRQPPCGPGWIAVGGHAARFDPLSGSGTAQAVRTAVLAAAAIDAVDRGADELDVRAHVTDRVLTAFTEHVRTCLGLYTSALVGGDLVGGDLVGGDPVGGDPVGGGPAGGGPVGGGPGSARTSWGAGRAGLDPAAWQDEIDLTAAALRGFGLAAAPSPRFTLTGPLPGWRLVPHSP